MELIDPRILFGARGVTLPDPAEVERRQLVNDGLRDARARRLEEDEAKRRAAEELALLRTALPRVIQAGFSDESIVTADPRVQPALLKMQGEALKGRADLGKTKAETADKEAQTRDRVLKWVGGNAYELSNRPNLTPDDVAGFVQHARALGADVASLGGMPTDPSPQALAQYMRRIANMSVGAESQIRFAGDAEQRAETARHNRAGELNTVRGQDLTADTTRRGQNMTDARAREFNQVTRDSNVGKVTRDTEMKLADDYRTQSKGWQETATAIGKVKTALKTATTNPGSALAAGTAFMKILDPNSVVRESELGMALNASGWFDRAANIGQVLMSGKVMTPAQAKALGDASDALFAEAAATQRQIDAAYNKRALDYGADPSRVIIDLGQNRAPGGTPAAFNNGREAGGSISAAPPPMPKIGEVQKGHIYKGGNPADPNSWEKVR